MHSASLNCGSVIRLETIFSEEAEWEDYFLQELKKATEIKTKIETTRSGNRPKGLRALLIGKKIKIIEE